MLWRLLQLSVAFAVYSANIYWGWTNNGYIASAWAFMAAYAVTVFPFTVHRWWVKRRLKRELLVAEEVHSHHVARRNRPTGNRLFP